MKLIFLIGIYENILVALTYFKIFPTKAKPKTPFTDPLNYSFYLYF